MDDNELKLHLADIEARRFSEKIGLAKHALTLAATVGSVWVVFDGLHRVLFGQGASEIAAFAHVVEAINGGTWMVGAYGAGMTIAWRRERSGKKRAIREKSHYQKMVERGDAYRAGSGLDETGDTPEEG